MSTHRQAPRRLRLNDDALAQKIRWEGGLWAALEYGIAAEDIENPQLADLWERMRRAFRDFAPLFEEVQARLDVAA